MGTSVDQYNINEPNQYNTVPFLIGSSLSWDVPQIVGFLWLGADSACIVD